MAYATHEFFHTRGFLYVHTPLITASDCEGAGEQFTVTTMSVGESRIWGALTRGVCVWKVVVQIADHVPRFYEFFPQCVLFVL